MTGTPVLPPPRHESSDTLERDPTLDGVRGLALGMVMVGHAFALASKGPITRAVHVTMDSMQIGLDLFFVLSGFLISSILIRTRDDDGYFVNFYARRVLRIFPAYYLVLLGVYVGRPLLFGAPAWQAAIDREAPYYLLYVQNLVMAWRGEGLGWVGLFHTFSLAIEEQFYLAWPLLIWCTPKHHLLRVCLLLCASSLAIKVAMFTAGMSWWAVYMGTVPRLHALAAGGALALWTRAPHGRGTPPWLRIVGAFAGVCLAGEVIVRTLGWTGRETHGFLLNITATPLFAWLLFEVIAAPNKATIRRLLRTPPLLFLGTYSYGLYLIHPIILWEIRTALPSWGDAIGLNSALLLTGVIGITLSLLLALAMYHAVELPILSLKRYFVPSSRRPTSLADSAGHESAK